MNALRKYDDLSDASYQITNIPNIEIKSKTSSAEIFPKEKIQTLEALELLKHLDEDWNGYGAQKPSLSSINNAISFIENVPLPNQFPSKIYPDGEGHIVMVWTKGSARLIVTVESLVVHYSYEQPNERPIFKDDILFDGISIPQDLKSILPKRK